LKEKGAPLFLRIKGGNRRLSVVRKGGEKEWGKAYPDSREKGTSKASLVWGRGGILSYEKRKRGERKKIYPFYLRDEGKRGTLSSSAKRKKGSRKRTHFTPISGGIGKKAYRKEKKKRKKPLFAY